MFLIHGHAPHSKVRFMSRFIFLALVISLVAGQANLKTLPVCAVVCGGAAVNGTNCAATNVSRSMTPETRIF